MTALPQFETIELSRKWRRLTITMNRPEVLNAFGGPMHGEFVAALEFAATDPGSDVVVITGAGRAFSAGGDIDAMQHFVDNPDEFAGEVDMAKRLIFALLDIEKPVIARINGAAVGLGATIALFCDVTFAVDTAKIGDPHVAIGLVAGDGGAVIWPQLVGLHRAKEFLMTGELLTAKRAADMGLVNHVLPKKGLDSAVDGFCELLLVGAQPAIRGTKAILNIELRRVAEAVLGPGLEREAETLRSAEHRARVAEFARKARRK